MAKKALVIKAAAKPKFKVRGYTRCQKSVSYTHLTLPTKA